MTPARQYTAPSDPRYRESGVLPVVFNDPIVVHVYPELDPGDPDATPRFRIVVLDDRAGQRYGLSRRHDITIRSGVGAHVSVAPDGSTRISIAGPVTMYWGPCVDIAAMIQ